MKVRIRIIVDVDVEYEKSEGRTEIVETALELVRRHPTCCGSGSHGRYRMKRTGRAVLFRQRRQHGTTLKQSAVREAEKLGITVRKSWSKNRILEEIDKKKVR